VSELLVIGYPDMQTAAQAAATVHELEHELLVQPDAVAVIVRQPDGKFQVTTNHHPVGAGASWGLLWGVLFGLLFFVPILGLVLGAGIGALGGLVDKTLIDREFRDRVRDLVQPGTSALFLVVERVPSDKVVAALSRYGGTVLRSSLDSQAEAELQRALHHAANA
jgi:uncharacterized membrane protein